jgi:hypothetical protein
MNNAQRDSRGWYAIEGVPTSEAIEALRQVGPIDKLSLVKGPVITVKVAKLLCSLPFVEWLWLWCDVTRAAVSQVIRVPGLVSLDLLAIRKPGTLSGFEQASTLRVLRANQSLEEKDLIAIAKAPRLHELGAQGADLTPKALDALLSLPELGSLDLEGTLFNDEMAHLIGQSTSIHSLDLGATKLTRRGLEFLSSMKQLRSLDLWATSLRERDLELLRSFPHLEYVSVGGYAGSDSLDAAYLVSLFGSLPSLKRVWLDGVDIAEAELAVLRERLTSVRVTSSDPA